MMQVHTGRQKFHAVATCSKMLPCLQTLALFVLTICAISHAAEAPRFVEKDGRWALLVDGHPYLILGGQVHNSSGWPSELPAVWKSLAKLHANTVEAPVFGSRWNRRRESLTGAMWMPSSKAPVNTIFTLSCSGSAPGRTATCTTRRSG